MDDESSIDNTVSDELTNSKCLDITLSCVIDEYSKDKERANSLDNKTTALITVLIALLTIYIPMVPFDKLGETFVNGSNLDIVILTVAVIIILLSAITAVIAFYSLINVIRLKDYTRLDINVLSLYKDLSTNEVEYKHTVCDHYIEIINNNSKINDKKAEKISKCFAYIIQIFIFLFLSIILFHII